LRNVSDRSTLVAKGPPNVSDQTAMANSRASAAALTDGYLTPGTTAEEAKRQLIEVTLRQTGGNKTRAAELLGISLKTVHNWLKRMKEERREK